MGEDGTWFVCSVLDALLCGEVEESMGVFENDNEVGLRVERDKASALLHDILSAYGSPAFWDSINATKVPLEVLAQVIQDGAISCDKRAQHRLFEIICERTRVSNEMWASSRLSAAARAQGELDSLVHDLCADLHVGMYQSLVCKKRGDWGEDFLRCLRYERKHVLHSFMYREHLWQAPNVKRGMRIPRSHMISIDHKRDTDGYSTVFDIEDGEAQMMMRCVELSDVRQCVLAIPFRLQVIIQLIFWGGQSRKEAAQALHISDRTVRNRLQEAYKLLRESLASAYMYM